MRVLGGEEQKVESSRLKSRYLWLYYLALRPRTNGGAERANQTIERYLRVYCSYQQDDQVDWLPTAELALDNHVNVTTGMTPFFANNGRHPRMDF